MRKMRLLLFCIALLFVGGCVSEPEETTASGNGTSLEESNASLGNETETQNFPSLPAGQCTPGWTCLSGQIKAYRTGNCTFIERRECPLGCQNDTCRASSICEQGFKCLDERRVGYQTLVCTWDHVKECPAGCANGDCLPENATAQNASAEAAPQTAEIPAPPPDTSKSLQPGEQAILENNGEEYVLEIYILEESRVRLSLGGAKSDWLEEGDSFTARGITITVKEILFQSYGGGTREIRYTVN
ncbi:MAG: hypothetical protein Q8R53_03280 [Nanoarchaeota archaeon]|nr:hypothetical protein [Nanoarchaeota archaeon]